MESKRSIIFKIYRKIRSIVKSIQEENRYKKNASYVKSLSDKSNFPRKIIIDCGFNQGIVADRLLRDLPDFSLTGFEIQQDIKEFSHKIKTKYPDRNIDVIYAAISDHDGEISYFEPEKWGKNFKGGTTTVNNKESMSVNYTDPKTAPCIDFSMWLKTNVQDEDFVFIKMDIEGAEYDVIDHLMKTGAIDLIDILAVEWHANKFPEPQKSRYLEIEENIKSYANNSRISVLDWY